MTPTRRPSLLALAAVALAACGLDVGNNHVVTEQCAVPAFSKLSVQSGFRAVLSRGERELALTADENLLPVLEAFVQDDTLVLRVRPHHAVTSTHGLEAVVNNPVLTALDASGGSIVDAAASGAIAWPIAASGGSEVAVSGLSATRVTLDASGGSRARLFGLATQLDLVGSGGSQVSADGLYAQDVTLNASGGSIVRVRASRSVQGDASGGSQVSVSGTPQTRQVTVSGGSTVTYGTE